MPLDPRSARPADLKILESVVPGLVGCIATHPQFQVPWVLETVQRQNVSCSSDLLLFETREIFFRRQYSMQLVELSRLMFLVFSILRLLLCPKHYSFEEKFARRPTDGWRLSSI